MRGPEDDHHLTLAAVGLWHRMQVGVPLGPIEVLVLVGVPAERGPLDDPLGALAELLATGWVVERGDAYVAVEPESHQA